MNEAKRRVWLYGSGLAIVGGLLGSWWMQRSDADAITLLSSADVQLRMAYAMPLADREGRVLPARAELIAAAEQNLATVDRMTPGMACTAEFRGFAHMLRGECAAAAAAYRTARTCADCTAEQRDVLVFNEARMLAKAGRGTEALAVFAANAEPLDERYGPQRRIEEIGILCDLGRKDEAQARLEAILSESSLDALARLQGAQLCERIGQLLAAQANYQAVAEQVPIANYHLARLKLASGDVDTAFVLLERAASAAPAEVRRLLQEEPSVWQVAAADARFQEYLPLRAATPGR
ncbi:MAG: hypothetical protein JNK49_15080 [Planctomycetes bacterium]|nr:hypothetical protein [Planctomycetota bacterium]